MRSTNLRKPSAIVTMIGGFVLIGAAIFAFVSNKYISFGFILLPLIFIGIYDIVNALFILLEVFMLWDKKDHSRAYITLMLFMILTTLVGLLSLTWPANYSLIPHLIGCGLALVGAMLEFVERRKGLSSSNRDDRAYRAKRFY
nr:hypothetical protein [Candidatus Sigynarchaeota archaeon]